MEMTILEQSNELTHVALVGRLDIAGVQQIEKAFLDATAARKKPTLVDVCGLMFVSSFGLGMLLKCAAILKVSGIKMVLLNPQPTVAELFEIAQIGQFISVLQDKEEAIALLRGE